MDGRSAAAVRSGRMAGRPPRAAAAAARPLPPPALIGPRWVFPVVISVFVFVQTPTGNAAQRGYGEIGW